MNVARLRFKSWFGNNTKTKLCCYSLAVPERTMGQDRYKQGRVTFALKWPVGFTPPDWLGGTYLIHPAMEAKTSCAQELTCQIKGVEFAVSAPLGTTRTLSDSERIIT